MKRPIKTPEESRRSYHSGLSGRMIEPADFIARADRGTRDRVIEFETAHYHPPFKVTVRTNVLGWDHDIDGVYNATTHRWTFTLPGGTFPSDFWMKLVLDKFFWMVGDDVKVDGSEGYRFFAQAQILFAYEILFQTNRWQPNHLITLRNSDDGWGQDIYGEFRDDRWQFLLDRAYYSASVDVKLMLERWQFMNGANLTLNAVTPRLELDDTTVDFAASPTAYIHGYDNFLAVESPLEQLSISAVGREGIDYDVIIIGSGMGGGALADALSDRGAKVLVLEAGGLRFPVHVNELPRTEVDVVERDQIGHFVNKGPEKLAQAVHFNLGGRSVYWSGVIPRMSEWELRPVWPTAVKNYLLTGSGGVSGYEHAEQLLRKQKTLGPFQDLVRCHLALTLGANYVVFDLPRSLHQPDVDAAGKLVNVVERSTGGYSTADLLLDSLGFGGKPGRDNLRVSLQHLATKIEKAGNKATEVVCQDLVGKVERRFQGKYIVLACGSLESPKLALNSQLNDPNAKMGIGLTDHPEYFYEIHHDLPTSGPLGWLGDQGGHAKIMIRHAAANSASHAYNIELLINSKYWDNRHADDDLWKSLVDNGQSSKVEIKFLFDSPLQDTHKVVANGEGRKVDVYIDANPPDVHYKQEVVDVRNLVLGALGITGLSTAWNDREWSQGIYGTVHHAAGTLRMSGDGSGVVDEDLKFLAYDNLYCCDASVFPSTPAANPSLTLTALALRLSHKLASRLGLP